MGDGYLRSLLVVGAAGAIRFAKEKGSEKTLETEASRQKAGARRGGRARQQNGEYRLGGDDEGGELSCRCSQIDPTSQGAPRTRLGKMKDKRCNKVIPGIGTTRTGQRNKARWNDQRTDPRNTSGPAANQAAHKGRTYGCKRPNC